MRSGSASPVTIKQEMEDYQDKVEAHFDETSEKFKQMATQYQDLYKHLSVGATTLCRPENIAPGLVADKDPLSNKPALDDQSKADAEPKLDVDSKLDDSKDVSKETADKLETDSKIKADQVKAKKAESDSTDKEDVSKKESATTDAKADKK